MVNIKAHSYAERSHATKGKKIGSRDSSRPQVARHPQPKVVRTKNANTYGKQSSGAKNSADYIVPGDSPVKLDGVSAGEEKREVLTSLFSGNPHIPHIPESKVTRISEKLFSDDSFSSAGITPKLVSILTMF